MDPVVPPPPNKLLQILKDKRFLIVATVIVLGVGLVVAVALAPSEKPMTTISKGQPTAIPQPTTFSQGQTIQSVSGQAAVDAEYIAWERDVLTEYPWLQKLPLQIPNGFVYFDLNRKRFVGMVYTKDSSKVNGLKYDILGMLRDRGIETKDYPIEWTVVLE